VARTFLGNPVSDGVERERASFYVDEAEIAHHHSSKSKVAIHGNAIAGATPDDARLIACVSALVGKRVLPASTGSRSNLQRVYQA
jgi:hypothetical protein